MVNIRELPGVALVIVFELNWYFEITLLPRRKVSLTLTSCLRVINFWLKITWMVFQNDGPKTSAQKTWRRNSSQNLQDCHRMLRNNCSKRRVPSPLQGIRAGIYAHGALEHHIFLSLRETQAHLVTEKHLGKTRKIIPSECWTRIHQSATLVKGI